MEPEKPLENFLQLSIDRERRMNEMSERDSGETEFEGSNIKKIRLDDDSEVSSSSSRACSAGSDSEDEDRRSSSVSSGCSSSETRLPFLDLEAHQQISETETETSTLMTINFRPSHSSEIRGETAEMDSATTEKRDREKPEKKEKSPTQAELDDFFSAAERHQQKRFTDKYNYDIVNDTPLVGRYEWVSLKP